MCQPLDRSLPPDRLHDAPTTGTRRHHRHDARALRRERAVDFERGTQDHDVTQNLAALMRHIDAPRPWTILDFGCGPGRDLKTIAAMGHVPVGLDGSEAFVRRAREATGATVLHQNFVDLDLPTGAYDGIFANASLQHVPRAVLPRSSQAARWRCAARRAVRVDPARRQRGGMERRAYSVYHDLDGWRRFVGAAGFVELEHFYRPAGRPFDEQRWLAASGAATGGPRRNVSRRE